MSKIHYFQRYSQKENWVTNNTMLLLSRLNYFNPRKFEEVINTFLGNQSSVNIGVSFAQQERTTESVPDAVIFQQSFEIKIETKLFDNFSSNQLKKHLLGFKETSEMKILLSLSKQIINESTVLEINKEIKNGNYGNLKFAAISFKSLINSIYTVLEPHETELREIIEDFASLCEEQNLIDLTNQTLLGVTVGLSLKENLKYGIYYDPIGRNHNRGFKFLGLYDNKQIKAVGKISKIAYCNLVKGELQSSNGNPLNLSCDEKKRIIDIIENTEYYDLRTGNKFILVEQFYDTSFNKVSISSLRGKKYFDLEDYMNYRDDISTEEVASQLLNKEWV